MDSFGFYGFKVGRRFKDIKKCLKNRIFDSLEKLKIKLVRFYFHIQMSKLNLWFLIVNKGYEYMRIDVKCRLSN